MMINDISPAKKKFFFFVCVCVCVVNESLELFILMKLPNTSRL